tara:strand:+ start:1562 stop:2575 length:1014 start_codon:yes stop_codon:yes gene_type:complete
MEKSVVEYIWIGGKGELRNKTRVLGKIDNVLKIPFWNYDGSSTNQANGDFSEVILKPQGMFKDPFRRDGRSFIVICDTWNPDETPHPTNKREPAKLFFENIKNEKPWFGLEQEYFLLNKQTKKPWGISADIDDLEAQGKYYCGVGTGTAMGRHIVEEHLQACLYAGVNISGLNAEVAPGQWEFQIGPCEGIVQGDHMWTARYLLLRVCEKYGMEPIFDNKPFKGSDWNGSGCHINFSTKDMRDVGGLEHILKAIEKLGKKHNEHMKVYGENNLERMTGKCETASANVFTWGVADRTASIRIGTDTNKKKSGYLEDRRPGANSDPYVTTKIICETIFS